ncbi:hypothetical protein SAMN04489742_4765 [Arthrobacter crystallopoietes]|uniref:Uncharacterized protein n=1 Tax=Crystallibacter crystallopoietes TaxID=37928 RepID=A0A1H1HXE4_9MICC|nr:hypothetical protein SAMN04489742_4765 [Arthrobacter crystallopoietes]
MLFLLKGQWAGQSFRTLGIDMKLPAGDHAGSRKHAPATGQTEGSSGRAIPAGSGPHPVTKAIAPAVICVNEITIATLLGVPAGKAMPRIVGRVWPPADGSRNSRLSNRGNTTPRRPCAGRRYGNRMPAAGSKASAAAYCLSSVELYRG